MRGIVIFLLLFIAGSSLGFSQEEALNEVHKTEFDNSIHRALYRITYSSIHIVELVEHKNNSFSGSLTNVVTRYGDREDKDYVQTINFSPETVEELMRELENFGIEKLTPCGEIPETDCVASLDGDETIFYIETDNTKKKLFFDALAPGEEASPLFPKNQAKAQRILNLINGKYDFSESLRSFMKQLPRGTYGYYGTTMINLN